MKAGAAQVTHVPVEGGEIACAHAGAGAGARAVLVLLHGWTLDQRMWAPQLAAFAPERLVLAPDRRGFGASTAPPDLAREADDLVRLLDRFVASSAVIVGMSQAGRVALDFAARFGARVSALVLQGAPASGVTPGPSPDETIPIVEYARLAREGRLDEMRRRWRSHPLMRTTTPEASLAANRVLDDYAGRDLSAASYLRDLDPQDFAGVDAPALIITGAHDTPWRRRAGDALARTLPHATRIELADAGHLCNLDRPDAYNDALRGFLERIGV